MNVKMLGNLSKGKHHGTLQRHSRREWFAIWPWLLFPFPLPLDLAPKYIYLPLPPFLTPKSKPVSSQALVSLFLPSPKGSFEIKSHHVFSYFKTLLSYHITFRIPTKLLTAACSPMVPLACDKLLTFPAFFCQHPMLTLAVVVAAFMGEGKDGKQFPSYRPMLSHWNRLLRIQYLFWCVRLCLGLKRRRPGFVRQESESMVLGLWLSMATVTMLIL